MAKANLVQLAAKLETTPGTVESLTAGEVDIRLREGYAMEVEHEMIELEELRDNSSKSAAIAGRSLVNFNVSHVVRGPGNLTTVPAVKALLNAALFTGGAAKGFDPGTITGGPFLPGETITGAGGGKALVLTRVANGATDLPYLPVSGTINITESITGGTSGATCTSGSSIHDNGYAFRPADPDLDVTGNSITAQLLRDGFQWTARGCLANLEIQTRNGGPLILNQQIQGALSTVGDAALYTGVTYSEDSVAPPRLLNAGLGIGTTPYKPTGVREITINFPTNPAVIEDCNSTAADGVLYSGYSRDLPTVSFECDQVLTTAYDYFATFGAGTTQILEFKVGSTSGSQWTFSAPAAQFRTVRPASRDPNRASFQVEMGLTGDNNNELLIWQH